LVSLLDHSRVSLTCVTLYTCVLCSAVLVPLYCCVRLDVVTTSYKIRRITRTRVSAVRQTDRKRGGSDRPLPYLSLSLTRKATKPFPNPESNTSLSLTRKATQAFLLHGKQAKSLPNQESKPSLSLTRKATQVSPSHGKQPTSLPNQDSSSSLSLNRKAIQVSP
jgi:hypothetical protein